MLCRLKNDLNAQIQLKFNVFDENQTANKMSIELIRTHNMCTIILSVNFMHGIGIQFKMVLYFFPLCMQFFLSCNNFVYLFWSIVLTNQLDQHAIAIKWQFSHSIELEHFLIIIIADPREFMGIFIVLIEPSVHIIAALPLPVIFIR